MFRRPLHVFSRCLWWSLSAAVVVAAIGVVAPYMAEYTWPCELLSHFQVQYVVLLAILTVLFLAGRRLAWAVSAALVAVAAACVHLLPLYRAPSALIEGEITGQVAPLRVVSANIAFFNRRHDLLIDLIVTEQPDVVLLYEVSPAWLPSLQILQATLPYHEIHPAEGHPGIAIFSRLPLDHVEVTQIGDGTSPVMVARLRPPTGDKQLTLVGTHPHPPVSPSATRLRNVQLRQLIDLVNEQPKPVAVFGDLNCTSWNPIFQQVLRDAQLRDSRLGFGVAPTWHARLLPLQIPIDHCLVSDEIRILSRRVGPYIGSDHYPLVVELAVP